MVLLTYRPIFFLGMWWPSFDKELRFIVSGFYGINKALKYIQSDCPIKFPLVLHFICPCIVRNTTLLNLFCVSAFLVTFKNLCGLLLPLNKNILQVLILSLLSFLNDFYIFINAVQNFQDFTNPWILITLTKIAQIILILGHCPSGTSSAMTLQVAQTFHLFQVQKNRSMCRYY